jgi:molecular chaperone DnaK
MAADNKSLGRFTLEGIPPAPRGIPQIEVTFDIDADGILKVSALDKATGNKQAITIHASSGLNDDEVERMRIEAKEFAEQDQRRREVAEARNTADQAMYTAEKLLREFSDRIPEDIQAELRDRVGGVRDAIEKKDTGILTSSTEALNDSISKVGGELKAQAEASAASEIGGTPDDETEGGASPEAE